MNIVRFYNNKIPINQYKNGYFNDILYKWTDIDFQTRDYIDWLFPLKSSPKIFEKIEIRVKVVLIALRILNFYSYSFNIKTSKLKRIKPICRQLLGEWVGLCSVNNFPHLTQIMTFLNKIDLFLFSSVFFLSICKAMKNDNEFKNKVIKYNYLPLWTTTQPYLDEYKDDILDLDWIQGEYSDVSDGSLTDFSDYSSQFSSSISRPITRSKSICPFQGLNYINNSCYQDSVLLALFALPNKIITKYILNSRVEKIYEKKHKWKECSKDKQLDFIIRQNIQNELIHITNILRHPEEKSHTCSQLRQLIAKCPGTQEFHGFEMQDAGEFLSYLFSIFQVDIAQTSNTTYVSNGVNWIKLDTIQDKLASPIISVDSWRIQDTSQSKYINEFLIQVDNIELDDNNPYIYKEHNHSYIKPGEKFYRKRSIWKMEKTDYLVFYIHRLNPVDNKKLKTVIIPPERISNLSLHAIIVHYKEHYTCFIKCNNTWFYYNDAPQSNIEKIGSYDVMLEQRPSPLKHGTLYFYT